MSSFTIRTNNVPRDVINDYELPEKEQKEFDYLDWDKIKEGSESATFFRFRGQLYDLSQFCRVIPSGAKSSHPCDCDNPAFAGWDGYLSDSFFSGMLIRWAKDWDGKPDFERVVVAVYCS